MTVYIHDHEFDELKGRDPEEAKKLIPKMRIEEPSTPEEHAFLEYWQGIRMRQLVEGEIKLQTQCGGEVAELEEKLSQLPLYDDTPPYDLAKIGQGENEWHIEHLEEIRQNLIYNRVIIDNSRYSHKTYLTLNPKGWDLARKGALSIFCHSILRSKLRGMKPLCNQLATVITQEYAQGYVRHFHIVPFDGPPFHNAITHEGFINAILENYITALTPTEEDFNTLRELYIPQHYWDRIAVVIPSQNLMNGVPTDDIGFATSLNKDWHVIPDE